MFAVDARTPGPPLTTDQPLTLLSDVGIVELGTSATWAAHAADVMVDEALAYVADRTTGDEFLPADRVATGCAQLLAFLDGRLVGCGSLSVIRIGGQVTGGLGADDTVPAAGRHGVQPALVRHRLQLAADAGCDFVGATAAVGSTSSRVLSDPRPQVGDGAALDLRRLAAPVLLPRRREPCGC